jgi:multisubunit Na+/H+ antiporter MnhC subunit
MSDIVTDAAAILKAYWTFIVPLVVAGVYCLVATRNFIRALIGLEIITKAVTLLIIAAGWASGRLAVAQSLVITLIVVEVVVITVAAGIVQKVFGLNESLDIRKTRNMKG